MAETNYNAGRLFPVWETWDGKRCRNRETGEVFIATRSRDWAHRLTIWKTEVQKVDHIQDCPCPSPLPTGHVNFRGSAVYEVL